MLYGYVDYTLENPARPFYVGIGNIGRVKAIRRNIKHTNVSEQLGRHRVIEFETSSEVQLKAWEVGTIAEYHTFIIDPNYNGIGCNLTKGGDGIMGCSFTSEMRERRSQQQKKRWKSQEERQRASVRATKGNLKRWSSPLERQKASERRKQILQEHPEINDRISTSLKSSEKAAAASEARRGKKRSDEVRQHMREGNAKNRINRSQAQLKRREKERNS